jgi:carbonic anhydrase/acetyltransferase-like protein (isoleucine patch superfamily)
MAVVGRDVSVGHMALLHACEVQDGAFIGMHSTILDGAVVEGGAMVAAGAVVTPGKIVRRGELWAGNPAQKTARPDGEGHGNLQVGRCPLREVV